MRIVAATLMALWASSANAQDFGSFIGSVVAKWNDDGRTMTLLEPFSYVDPLGIRWDAPAGVSVDGASIPTFAWSIIGGPFEGKYRNASVIHDVACVEKKRSWDKVHHAFYTGMLASGVSSMKAKVMYAAVYHFGPRWPEQKEIRQTTSQLVEQRFCMDIGIGDPVCVVVPRTTTPVETIVRIDVPPPPQTLTREAFERLEKEIEGNESGPTALTLEQIQEYR